MDNDPFDFEDNRTEEPLEDNDRQKNFVEGWNKAVRGEEYGEALDSLSWRTLGWRLGMIFGDTDRKMINMMYFWCVEQQGTYPKR
jgi:hypothetical protein